MISWWQVLPVNVTGESELTQLKNKYNRKERICAGIYSLKSLYNTVSVYMQLDTISRFFCRKYIYLSFFFRTSNTAAKESAAKAVKTPV